MKPEDIVHLTTAEVERAISALEDFRRIQDTLVGQGLYANDMSSYRVDWAIRSLKESLARSED